MKLSLEETQLLLRISKFAILDSRNKRDSVIIYGLTHNLTVFETDDIFGLGESDVKEDLSNYRDSSEDNLAYKETSSAALNAALNAETGAVTQETNPAAVPNAGAQKVAVQPQAAPVAVQPAQTQSPVQAAQQQVAAAAPVQRQQPVSAFPAVGTTAQPTAQAVAPAAPVSQVASAPQVAVQAVQPTAVQPVPTQQVVVQPVQQQAVSAQPVASQPVAVTSDVL